MHSGILALCLALILTACAGNSVSPGTASSVPAGDGSTASRSPGSSASSAAETGNLSEGDGAPLIVYFSRAENIEFDPEVDAVSSASINLDGDTVTGNAAVLAEMVREETGGTVVSLHTQEKYPSAYEATTEQATEEKAAGTRPALEEFPEDLDGADTVVLIYPIWWSELPMPVYTFLESCDFTGVTLLPIATHEGSGLAGTVRSITQACPGATVGEGLAVRGDSVAQAREDVREWLTGSGVPVRAEEAAP